MSSTAQIYIVDDDTDVRDSLTLLLESVGIKVTAFANADSFLQEYRHQPQKPGCMLLDVRMPGLSGIALLEEMQRESISIPVIILTGHGDIPMSVQAMKLGAVDFVTKPFNTQKLLDLVQDVLRTPPIHNSTDKIDIDLNTAHQLWQTLTPREQEVFTYIVSGISNKVIGIDLGISIRTVETHRARIMEKLEARTLVDLVRLSMRLGDRAQLQPQNIHSPS